ncbi:NHLP bacteriocin export ABC transporter permease/ATPase subunit [Kamptonema sp. UHCC 0994]|uniref:NHLP bacteriocin export ABC transporter permease/ATPase subunit n=1 Tax=Kamptonema sp. UHCC 0994 TaxID=3031329 RepID=UPI0023B9A734|nr:NHLP bacteriocin export ABC transporter permease/ATPase subunit [Kamptonema sp. UHCC 0994]MDF0555520.1 NHLP bacteriocin export ABC transporter permease/ATPase subunit [Kamptonema sp. UHCC 0994]
MAISQQKQAEVAQKLAQFQETENFNRQVTAKAIGEIASLIKPQSQESFPEGDPLLIAAKAVGEAMGITINSTASSENLNQLRDPIKAIARASGIRIRRVTLRDRWWQKDCGPLLGYLQQENQPVALLPTKPGNYELFDPILRTRTPVSESQAKLLSPVAYMFYRSLPQRAILVNNADAIAGWDLLWFTLQDRRLEILTLLWIGICVALLGAIAPYATAILIDDAIPDANRKLLWQVGLGLLAASLGSTIFQLVQGFAIVRLQILAESIAQTALWDRLLNLKISFFREYSTADILIRVSGISQISHLLSSSVTQILFTSFFSLLNIGLLFFYSPQLALVAFTIALIAMLVTITASILINQQLRPRQEQQGKILDLTVQLIEGISKLRVAGAQNRAFAYWASEYTQLLERVRNTQFIKDLLQSFNTVLPTASQIVIFALTVSIINQSEPGKDLSTGMFLAFNAAFGTFITGITNLSNTVVEILEIGILWERTQLIINAESEQNLTQADPGKLLGHLKLDRVSFRYYPNSPLVLEEINLEVQPGEFIAIVGASGSGKSTIIRLLLRFETPEEGTIYYDGQDLAQLDISAVRQQLGVVLQNSRLFTGSIFENISGGALLTLDEAWDAAEMAGLKAEIESMPMDMHTVISEGGSNLSGGQRQRLLIARALALKPKILIFDEATSALDNRTQAIVSQNIEQLQVTRIVIAHRLSTIRHADRIFVIEAGKIVQQGKFEELTSKDGLLAHIMARQLS